MSSFEREFWQRAAEGYAGTQCERLCWYYLLCLTANMQPAWPGKELA
jgi:hypothetical protein